MDVRHGCMPNGFGHILFGKLKSLYEDESEPYYGDRIYIKPEEFGLQKFKHFIGRECLVKVVANSFTVSMSIA